MWSKQKKLIATWTLILIGSGMTLLNWYWRLSEGHFGLKSAFFGPIFAMVGVAYLILPPLPLTATDRSLPFLRRFKNTPLKWNLVLILAIVLGFINLCLLKYL